MFKNDLCWVDSESLWEWILNCEFIKVFGPIVQSIPQCTACSGFFMVVDGRMDRRREVHSGKEWGWDGWYWDWSRQQQTELIRNFLHFERVLQSQYFKGQFLEKVVLYPLRYYILLMYIVARIEAEMDGIEIGFDSNKPSWSETSYILSSILKGSYRILPPYIMNGRL